MPNWISETTTPEPAVAETPEVQTAVPVVEPIETASVDGAEAPTEPAVEEVPEQTWVLKINGVDKTVGETEMLALAQKASAADQRFEQVSVMYKNLQQGLKTMKDNPGAVYERLNPDMSWRDYVVNTALDFIEEEELPEPEREQKQKNKRLVELEADAKQRAEQQAAQEQQALIAKVESTLVTMTEEALKLSGLEKDEFTVESSLKHLHAAIQNNENITSQQLAARVKADHDKLLTKVAKKLPASKPAPTLRTPAPEEQATQGAEASSKPQLTRAQWRAYLAEVGQS